MSNDKIVFNKKDLPENERMILCVQEIVKQTLFHLEEAQAERRAIVKKIQNLKMDLRDFRAGRLDRLYDRHLSYEDDETLSVIEIGRIEGEDYDRQKWSPRYQIGFQIKNLKVKVKLPGFLFHKHTEGTYDLGKGKIKHL